jgi:hypothetical protein
MILFKQRTEAEIEIGLSQHNVTSRASRSIHVIHR